MPFLTPLVAKAISGSEWQLTEPLIYQPPYGLYIKVPAGFPCDLASIPRLFQLLIPVNDSHRQAATLHDFLYAGRGVVEGTAVRQEFTRAECDVMFLDAMRESGVPRWKRYSMYLAVRAGGWAAWRD
jgi:hypothetical protein